MSDLLNELTSRYSEEDIRKAAGSIGENANFPGTVEDLLKKLNEKGRLSEIISAMECSGVRQINNAWNLNTGGTRDGETTDDNSLLDQSPPEPNLEQIEVPIELNFDRRIDPYHYGSFDYEGQIVAEKVLPLLEGLNGKAGELAYFNFDRRIPPADGEITYFVRPLLDGIRKKIIEMGEQQGKKIKVENWSLSEDVGEDFHLKVTCDYNTTGYTAYGVRSGGIGTMYPRFKVSINVIHS